LPRQYFLLQLPIPHFHFETLPPNLWIVAIINIHAGVKAMKPLSCHRLRANEARIQLSLLAYNLGNLWRRRVLSKRVDAWSLTSLQQRLVKKGGRLIKHARYSWLQLAESHLTRRLFGEMLRRIWALPMPSG